MSGKRGGAMSDSAAVEEVPVWLQVNGRDAVTWMCTPDLLEELGQMRSTKANSSQSKSRYEMLRAMETSCQYSVASCQSVIALSCQRLADS